MSARKNANVVDVEIMDRIKNLTRLVIYQGVTMPLSVATEFELVRRVKWQTFGYLLNQWNKFADLQLEQKQRLISELENSFYCYTKHLAQDRNIPQDWENENFIELYHAVCAEILANIDINNIANTSLVIGIIDNTINIEQLPRLSASELFPAKYADILSRIEQAKNVNTTVRTSKMYTCRRCKRSECKIENRYNRSLDEGTNLSITCVACGNQWNA